MKRTWMWALPVGGAVLLLGEQGCPIDMDEDGWTACGKDEDPLGGTCDCDDGRSDVYPGAEETCYDDIDQDCDGSDWTDCPGVPVKAHTGDVVITEVMHNTRMVLETEGQWFEITNVTPDKTFNLEGWTFGDGQRAWTVPLGEPYLLSPGQVATVGPNPDSINNGRVHIELICSNLYLATEQGFRISIAASDGTPIDWVQFSFEPGAFPYLEGHALALSSNQYSGELNDDPASWCVSFDPIHASTDFGTPWKPNPVCPPDVDGDAYTMDVDCNDLDASVNPGTAEVAGNGIDDDCDGEVDEAPKYQPGAVIITEIMYNPWQTFDRDGEWFEVYNTTDEPIDMEGWSVGDTLDTPDTHVILDKAIVEPHDYFVFGVNEDTTLNGGVEVDYVMPRLGFSNAYHAAEGFKDQIRIIYDNTLIDAVAYGDGTFPDVRGYSITLDADAYDHQANDIGHNWCLASSPITDDPWVDSGTPGAPNDICPPDEDNDGYRADLDCDDTDDAVHPGMEETVNGKDDDCNGAVDEDPPGPATVVICEFMANPEASLDIYGEYFELLNPSATYSVDVNGWTIRDGAGSSFVIDNGGPMVLVPYSFTLFARSAELPLNGDIEPEYAYGGALGLGESAADEVTVEYEGVLIDRVAYDPDNGWDIPSGASLEFSPDLFTRYNPDVTNDDPDNWCPGDVVYNSGGDRGTPGWGNSQCFL